MIKLKELENLAPYDREIRTKKAYIRTYFAINSPATYFNNGLMQCASMRNRSIRDMYYITKARFKTTTLQEFCRIAYELCFEEQSIIGFIFCGSVCDIVLYNKNIHNYNNFAELSSDDYPMKHFLNRETSSGITCNDFITLAKQKKK